MNCTTARECLPGLLYADLPPPETAAVRDHLERCPACQAEYGTLRQLRRLLDAAPAPGVAVDLPRLYEQAARLKDGKTRRWRRATIAAAAVAALLLLFFGLRLEVRLDGQQVVVRWGAAQTSTANPAHLPEPTAPAVAHLEPPAPTLTLEDLQLIKELIHALAADIDARDRRLQLALTRLHERLDTLRAQSDLRWADTRRNVAVLYTAQFGPREKGAQQ